MSKTMDLETSADDWDESQSDEASAPYLGQWNRLVSTTNWEKGRIINEWRESLFLEGAPPQSYSDEAWSRRVGNVSGQHVGRLRRVFERFGAVRETYPGLFWSHFQAALDWDDAEMWLEGAVQSDWTVSAMRQQRWQALGAPADKRPRDEDIIVGELDEDAMPMMTPSDAARESVEKVRDPVAKEREFDEVGYEAASYEEVPLDSGDASAPQGSTDALSPFAQLAELPDDLSDAVESMKLAIIRHKLAGWNDVRPNDVIDALHALKALVIAA